MGRKIANVNNLLEVGESELGSIYTYDVMIDLPEDGLTKSPAMLVRLDSLAQKAESYKLTKRTTTVLNIHHQAQTSIVVIDPIFRFATACILVKEQQLCHLFRIRRNTIISRISFVQGLIAGLLTVNMKENRWEF